MCRDYRNNKAALFDGIEEGGIRASSSYSSHEIDEHDNERAVDGLQDRVILLKRVSFYWPLSTRLDSTECGVHVLRFQIFFFLRVNSNITWFYCTGDKNTVHTLLTYCLCTIHGSHDTIHTFKNYFAIMFLVSVTISSIQTDPKLNYLSVVVGVPDWPACALLYGQRMD